MKAKNYKFYFLCDPREILKNLTNWTSFRFATIGLLKGETPKLVMIGDVEGMDESIVASIEFDWTKCENIPAFIHTTCSANFAGNNRSGVDITFSVSGHKEFYYAGKESELIRSIERYEDSFPAYHREFGEAFGKHNDKDVDEDVAFVIRDMLNEDLGNLILTPYRTACNVVESKQNRLAFINMAEQFVTQVIRDSIMQAFNETVDLVIQAAKHALIFAFNGLNVKEYVIDVLLGKKDLSHTMKCEYDADLIAMLTETLERLGIDSSWVVKFDANVFNKSMEKLVGMLPNVGKEDMRILYNGLEAFVENEKEGIENAEVVLIPQMNAFGPFSMN